MTSPIELIHFTNKELTKVCFDLKEGETAYDMCSIKALFGIDRIRDRIGKPMFCTCAYRSPEHDKAKGRSGTGDHTTGAGFDIAINNEREALEIQGYAIIEGFNAFGINLEAGFIHIGMRDLPLGIMKTWSY